VRGNAPLSARRVSQPMLEDNLAAEAQVSYAQSDSDKRGERRSAARATAAWRARLRVGGWAGPGSRPVRPRGLPTSCPCLFDPACHAGLSVDLCTASERLMERLTPFEPPDRAAADEVELESLQPPAAPSLVVRRRHALRLRVPAHAQLSPWVRGPRVGGGANDQGVARGRCHPRLPSSCWPVRDRCVERRA
jgi:hypothetical protein